MTDDNPERSTANNPLTEAAFGQLRTTFGTPRPPNQMAVRMEDEYEQMPIEEMDHWRDGGPVERSAHPPDIIPVSEKGKERLWVVRPDAVLHALKTCPFGASRQRGELKHTNLTGGDEAYCGGELMILDENTVVVNGDSGRYGPTNEEMDAVLAAFAQSGHRTYTTGYDVDVARPLPLTGVKLVRFA